MLSCLSTIVRNKIIQRKIIFMNLSYKMDAIALEYFDGVFFPVDCQFL